MRAPQHSCRRMVKQICTHLPEHLPSHCLRLQFGGGGIARANPLWPLGGKPAGGPERKRKPGGPLRVLILMSDTGGGHRASAEAIKAGFEEKFGKKYHVSWVATLVANF